MVKQYNKDLLEIGIDLENGIEPSVDRVLDLIINGGRVIDEDQFIMTLRVCDMLNCYYDNNDNTLLVDGDYVNAPKFIGSIIHRARVYCMDIYSKYSQKYKD